VRAFHSSGPTVYRIRAADLAGNASIASKAVVVVPAKRPTDVPKVLPRWAWQLYASQHGSGSRPTAAPHKLPAWYWHWAAWRSAPDRSRNVRRAGSDPQVPWATKFMLRAAFP